MWSNVILDFGHVEIIVNYIKAKQKSLFGGYATKLYNNTNHVKLKSRISRQWLTYKVGDSCYFFE